MEHHHMRVLYCSIALSILKHEKKGHGLSASPASIRANLDPLHIKATPTFLLPSYDARVRLGRLSIFGPWPLFTGNNSLPRNLLFTSSFNPSFLFFSPLNRPFSLSFLVSSLDFYPNIAIMRACVVRFDSGSGTTTDPPTEMPNV